MRFGKNRAYQGMKSTSGALDGKVSGIIRDPNFQEVTNSESELYIREDYTWSVLEHTSSAQSRKT